MEEPVKNLPLNRNLFLLLELVLTNRDKNRPLMKKELKEARSSDKVLKRVKSNDE